VKQLAVVWGRLVGQEFAVVQVKDVRGSSYLGEVTKYVVKANQLAAWHPQLINEFVHAIRGVRFFTTFGTLFTKGRAVRAELNAKRVPRICACGCSDFRFETETQSVLREVKMKTRRR
jgi:hypothetical protein